MKDTKSLRAVLEPLYDSVLEPARLMDFNQSLAFATESSISAVIVHDVANGHGDLSLVHGADPDELSTRLAQHDLHRDPWITRALPQLATGRVINSDELLPRAQMRRTDVFNDYYRRLDIGQQVASVGYYDGDASVTLSICRSMDAPAFADSQLQFMRELTPHWVNAYAIQRRLSCLQQRVATLESAIWLMPLAMFLVDANQRVVRMSEAAERIISTGAVVRMDRDRLRAAFDDRILNALLLRASCGVQKDGRSLCSSGTATLRDASGRHVLVANVHPLASSMQRRNGAKAVLFLHGVGLSVARDLKTLLRQIFGMTSAEASLAEALYQRADLSLAAEQVGISQASARTRLKLIFDKTGERGQPALIRLLAAVACGSDLRSGGCLRGSEITEGGR